MTFLGHTVQKSKRHAGFKIFPPFCFRFSRAPVTLAFQDVSFCIFCVLVLNVKATQLDLRLWIYVFFLIHER